MKRNKGFTLAEVLLVLIIIGIISSLTIPVVKRKIDETRYNIYAKKSLATLDGALRMIKARNSGSINNSNLREEFCNVMSCIKKDNITNLFSTNYRYYKGNFSGWPGDYTVIQAALLRDGNAVMFNYYGSCDNYGGFVCDWLAVDVNGAASPNEYGKDLFHYWITYKNGFYAVLPMGAMDDTYATLPDGCTAGSNSYETSCGCTALRLTNPKQMP